MKKKKELPPLSWSVRNHLRDWSNALIMNTLRKNKEKERDEELSSTRPSCDKAAESY